MCSAFTCPPLRDRKEDIADLVALFIQQFSAPFNKTVEKISPGYLASLINYPWPGNVRELRSAVEYSIAILDGKILLEEYLSGFLPQPSARSVPMTTEVEMEGVSIRRLPEMEEQAIRDTLVATKNNKRKAAGLLGISRSTLHRRLKKMSEGVRPL
jgi:transcriptional regulator with PAS, ATPase and Fis domain